MEIMVLLIGFAGAGSAGFAAMGIIMVAMLIFGIMFLFLLSRLSKAFREQAALAQRVWSAPAGPPVAPAEP